MSRSDFNPILFDIVYKYLASSIYVARHCKMIRGTFIILVLLQTTTTSKALVLKGPKSTFPSSSVSKNTLGDECGSRRNFFLDCGALSILTFASAPRNSNALASYSGNAKNIERINSGDYSGGSSYDNNPKAEAGKRRRAMVGCKSPVALEEAAELLKTSSLSEKDCNQKVLGGESEFMLQALRNQDCPTCPYGINSTRK